MFPKQLGGCRGPGGFFGVHWVLVAGAGLVPDPRCPTIFALKTNEKAIFWDHIVPHTIRMIQIVPDLIRMVQIVPDLIRMIQIVPDSIRMIQIVPNSSRMIQIVPNLNRMIQIVPNLS